MEPVGRRSTNFRNLVCKSNHRGLQDGHRMGSSRFQRDCTSDGWMQNRKPGAVYQAVPPSSHVIEEP